MPGTTENLNFIESKNDNNFNWIVIQRTKFGMEFFMS